MITTQPPITIQNDDHCYDIYHNSLGSSKIKRLEVFEKKIFNSIVNYAKTLNTQADAEKSACMDDSDVNCVTKDTDFQIKNVQTDFLLCLIISLAVDEEISKSLFSGELVSLRRELYREISNLILLQNQSQNDNEKLWETLSLLYDNKSDLVSDLFLDSFMEVAGSQNQGQNTDQKFTISQLNFLNKFCKSSQARLSRKLTVNFMISLVRQYMDSVKFYLTIDGHTSSTTSVPSNTNNSVDTSSNTLIEDFDYIHMSQSRRKKRKIRASGSPTKMDNQSKVKTTQTGLNLASCISSKMTHPIQEYSLILNILTTLISIRHDFSIILTDYKDFLNFIISKNLKRRSETILKLPTCQIFISLSKTNLSSLSNMNLVRDEFLISILVGMVADNKKHLCLGDRVRAANCLAEYLNCKHKLCRFAIEIEQLRECLRELIRIDLNDITMDITKSSNIDSIKKLQTGLKLFSVLSITDDCTRLLLYKLDNNTTIDTFNDFGKEIYSTFQKFKEPKNLPLIIRNEFLSCITSLSKSSHHLRKILNEINISRIIIDWIKFDIGCAEIFESDCLTDENLSKFAAIQEQNLKSCNFPENSTIEQTWLLN